ncbi:hypothetical protein Nepgr_019640 [Nepenthes gracilis]|uniref:Peptidase M16 C-terminal domain-containing protein n=1 Tax=Nepenthes gracilis TaxID=150966 RepID=A0AAD3SVK6_NEPGR|nr:hypothetical protein Nepgr_019640 [Nepenthes gracilis]
MVLATSRVKHEELLSIAKPLLSSLSNAPWPEEPKSIYVGKDYRCQANADNSHVALTFKIPSGWRNEKESVLATVLQMLLGGGGSFSTGGLGKGMHSRLYHRILNVHQQIQSFTTFNSIYNSTGIFGILDSTGTDYVGKTIFLAVGELIFVATPGQVHQVELNRSKEATKSAILMNLESRVVTSEDIGRQILTYGVRKPLDDLLKAKDAILISVEGSSGHGKWEELLVELTWLVAFSRDLQRPYAKLPSQRNALATWKFVNTPSPV